MKKRRPRSLQGVIKLLKERPGLGGPEHTAFYDLCDLIDDSIIPSLEKIKAVQESKEIKK